MRAVFLLFLFVFAAFYSPAQTVSGFVVNKDTRMRLAKVYIYNERIDEGVYNNATGEFKITAKPGDVLFAALEGYAVDTVVYNGQNAIYFQLTPLAINIKQVEIKSIMISPSEQYARLKQEYKYATVKGSAKDIFSIGPGGAGLSIDAIFALLSRQGRNARKLQAILERDYRESVIDYRFRPETIARILQIRNPELKDFMQQYRPTYNFVLTASDYAFIVFVKNSYASYKRAPDAFRLPLLPKINE